MAKADFFKKRAEEFFKTAEYHIGKKQYHLAAFDLEQAAQLLTGIGEAFGQQKKVEQMKKENINLISDLEQSYITSRYLPAEFTKTEVENMREWVKELIKLLKEL